MSADMSITRQLAAMQRCAARMRAQETEAQRARRAREAKKAEREELLRSLLPPPDAEPVRFPPIRAQLRAVIGTSVPHLDAMLRDLVERGQVERVGERSNSTYRRAQ
jgi:hypothetical protein